MQYGPFTIAIVLVTAVISFAAFSDRRLMDRLILWPQRMHSVGEYYRLLTSGFIHLDMTHLLFNMFTLFFMGTAVEQYFQMIGLSPWMYILLYLSAIVIASLPSFLKNRNNAYYRSLGASGGVAAVIFSFIYFQPWQKIYIFFFPIYSIVFAALYLIFSAYMSRKGRGNVNHDAHFWGAVFGLIFTGVVEPSHGRLFLEQIQQLPF